MTVKYLTIEDVIGVGQGLVKSAEEISECGLRGVCLGAIVEASIGDSRHCEHQLSIPTHMETEPLCYRYTTYMEIEPLYILQVH